MKTTIDTETAIARRCAALGLRRAQVQALGDLEQFPADLIHFLGLNPDTLAPLPSKRWLWMAAETSSVSYRRTLTSEILLSMLVRAEAPAEFLPHLRHFLNETPLQLMLLAIEQAAQQSGVPIASIWRNVAQLNRSTHGYRLGKVCDSMLQVMADESER